MKKLILVRHGKSSWDNPLEDKKRPLKPRGEKDATLIAEAFEPHFTEPIKLYTSKAVRAKTTAEIFKIILEIDDSDFQTTDELYTFDAEKILEFIKKQDDSEEQLMLFGHNPAFTVLVNDLGNRSMNNLPTTGLAVIEFAVEKWSNIEKGETLLTLFPKDFKG